MNGEISTHNFFPDSSLLDNSYLTDSDMGSAVASASKTNPSESETYPFEPINQTLVRQKLLEQIRDQMINSQRTHGISQPSQFSQLNLNFKNSLFHNQLNEISDQGQFKYPRSNDRSRKSKLREDREDRKIRLNQICCKSSHNSYRSEYDLEELFYLHHIRSFELDLHVDKYLSQSYRDWYVYHNFADLKTRYELFSEALQVLAKIHQQQPQHQVMTIFLDCNRFSEQSTPTDLDFLIESHLGPFLYRPLELKGSYETIHHRIFSQGMPTLAELQGKFIFILTKSQEDYTAQYRNVYQRSCFISETAYRIKDVLEMTYTPFFNLFCVNSVGKDIHRLGLMVRLWTINYEIQYQLALDHLTNFIATDEVTYDSLPPTTSIYGFPFHLYNPRYECFPQEKRLLDTTYQASDLELDSFLQLNFRGFYSFSLAGERQNLLKDFELSSLIYSYRSQESSFIFFSNVPNLASYLIQGSKYTSFFRRNRRRARIRHCSFILVTSREIIYTRRGKVYRQVIPQDYQHYQLCLRHRIVNNSNAYEVYLRLPSGLGNQKPNSFRQIFSLPSLSFFNYYGLGSYNTNRDQHGRIIFTQIKRNNQLLNIHDFNQIESQGSLQLTSHPLTH